MNLTDGSVNVAFRRYSELLAFHEAVKDTFPRIGFASFPPKHFFQRSQVG